MEILSDPSLHSRLCVIEKNKSDTFAPITRICSLFEDKTPPPPGSGPLLARFLDSESDEIRQSVGLALGAIGSAEFIPELLTALNDKKEYVRSSVLRGIEVAISENRISKESKEAFYSLVCNRLPVDTGFNVAKYIPEILLKLDPQKGLERLLQDDIFHPGFPRASNILEALSEAVLEIPRDKILQLIHETQKLPLKYPLTYLMEEALGILGGYRNDNDLSLLQEALQNTDKHVVQGAVKGLVRFYPALESKRDFGEVLSSPDWNSLPDWERQIASIELLDCEVSNGGFAQYYFNSSGNFWKEALAGLKAIGGKGHYSVMAETLAFFPKGSPSVETNPRNLQLAKIVGEGDDPFSPQDSAWYALKEENLELLIFKYLFAQLVNSGNTV